MRRILSWAAAAAIVAIAGGGWCQQTTGQQSQAQSSDADEYDQAQPPAPQAGLAGGRGAQGARGEEGCAKAGESLRQRQSPHIGRDFDRGSGKGSQGCETQAPRMRPVQLSPAAGEKAWRDKFASLRAKLARDQGRSGRDAARAGRAQRAELQRSRQGHAAGLDARRHQQEDRGHRREAEADPSRPASH